MPRKVLFLLFHICWRNIVSIKLEKEGKYWEGKIPLLDMILRLENPKESHETKNYYKEKDSQVVVTKLISKASSFYIHKQ